MGSESRKQQYLYQYKTVSASNVGFCSVGPTMSIALPTGLIAIKSLWVRIAMKFSTDTPTANWVLNAVSMAGGTSNFIIYTGNGGDPQTTKNTLYMNKVADSNGYVDFSADLTNLIPGIKIYPGTQINSPYFSMWASTLPQTNANGIIVLWKVDMTYTTRGIR